MLARIGRITNPEAAVLFAAAGFAAFFTGLAGPFMGDDVQQIVRNPFAQSLTNLPAMFSGGTFFGGAGLIGAYYRPLQTFLYALIYTAFGASPFYFHLVQLLIVTASAFLVFLVFAEFFKRGVALFLGLVFLLHPVNSQLAFAIPKLGDALSFFFGILAFWMAVRFRGTKWTLAVALCLFLSFMSKESGPAFLVLIAVYLWMNDRGRLGRLFVSATACVLILYVLLKAHATGLTVSNIVAPVDYASLGTRLLTVPSILALYLSRIIFPVPLATAYYWLANQVTLEGVIVPAVLDLVVAAVVVLLAAKVKRIGARDDYRRFLFFLLWVVVFLAPYLQVIPLDMTASETWLYAPMFGLLGAAALAASVVAPRVRLLRRLGRQDALAVAVILLLVLGGRTALRGLDWTSTYSLATADLAASPGNFYAKDVLAHTLVQRGEFSSAVPYATDAVNDFASGQTYSYLAEALLENEQYSDAQRAAVTGLSYNSAVASQGLYVLYGTASLYVGNWSQARPVVISAVNQYPSNGILWLDLAIIDQRLGNKAEAQAAATNAYNLGAIGASAYSDVVNGVINLPARPSIAD